MMKRKVFVGVVIWQNLNNTPLRHTTTNSVFTVRFAHPNAFGTPQTHKTLVEIHATFGEHTSTHPIYSSAYPNTRPPVR